MRELFKVLGIFKLWKKKNIYIYIKGHRCCNASSIATVVLRKPSGNGLNKLPVFCDKLFDQTKGIVISSCEEYH